MFNTVCLMGRLTAKPELKVTPNEISVTTFAIAVERSHKNGNEKITDFFDCVSWRNTAEFITKYFDKGDMIAITGELQTRNYEDKNGNKRKATEVVANNVSFCGSKKAAADDKDEAEDGIPF